MLFPAKSPRWEALMSFTMLPLRRTLRDDGRKGGKGDRERKMGSSSMRTQMRVHRYDVASN